MLPRSLQKAENQFIRHSTLFLTVPCGIIRKAKEYSNSHIRKLSVNMGHWENLSLFVSDTLFT